MGQPEGMSAFSVWSDLITTQLLPILFQASKWNTNIRFVCSFYVQMFALLPKVKINKCSFHIRESRTLPWGTPTSMSNSHQMKLFSWLTNLLPVRDVSRILLLIYRQGMFDFVDQANLVKLLRPTAPPSADGFTFDQQNPIAGKIVLVATFTSTGATRERPTATSAVSQHNI